MALSSTSLPAAAPAVTTLPTPANSVNGAHFHPDSDSPRKRKRLLDDIGGDRDLKMYLEDRKLGIEDLHLDVGHKYLLCQTRHPESLPRTSDDLFELFGLTGLAAEVAREKPNGEKNAIRKTYKGHIKRLGVSGHFDVQKKEDAPSDLMAMIQVPELEWNVHQVKGREIRDGLSDMTLSNLGRAMTMAKGPIPKAIWDSSVLGDLNPANADAPRPLSEKPTAPSTPLASTPGLMSRSKSQLPPGHDPSRPQRGILKRSYGDNSFEGYGEGFPDDDAVADTGYSTGEGEGAHKRRKKSSGNSPPYPTMRQQSYGPGMVGA